PVAAGTESLQLYIEARAPSGAVLARTGDEHAPVAVRVPARLRAPALALRPVADPSEGDDGTVFESPWFWAATAAVLGGAVAGYVALGPASAGPEAGSLGQGALE